VVERQKNKSKYRNKDEQEKKKTSTKYQLHHNHVGVATAILPPIRTAAGQVASTHNLQGVIINQAQQRATEWVRIRQSARANERVSPLQSNRYRALKLEDRGHYVDQISTVTLHLQLNSRSNSLKMILR
jgi:hypothetical protein